MRFHHALGALAAGIPGLVARGPLVTPASAASRTLVVLLPITVLIELRQSEQILRFSTWTKMRSSSGQSFPHFGHFTLAMTPLRRFANGPELNRGSEGGEAD